MFELLKGFAGEKGYKIGYVMWPLRTAGIRQTEHSGRSNRADGSVRQRGVLKPNPQRDGEAGSRVKEQNNLMTMNEEQKKAVTYGNGPCLVLAGPGSGKTLTIVNRIKYLIEEYKVRPEEILVVLLPVLRRLR